MKKLGCGEWSAELYIGVPWHEMETATLRYKVNAWKDAIEIVKRRDYSFILDPIRREEEERKPLDQLEKRFAKLIQFGGFGNGYCIYWDTNRILKGGDMKICIANARDRELYDFDGSLLEFIGEAFVSKRFNEICPLTGSRWNCKPVFKCM
ncbi:MAG: hypothetical protein HS116_24350 [Planctomycetes bacterium]|nr:hypothetical protein [Planctomycetota bacterium]